MNQKTTNPKNPGKKSGIALVGLGGYSSGQLGPALQETNNCYLAGIVTGTPSKEKSGANNTTSLQRIFIIMRILIA